MSHRSPPSHRLCAKTPRSGSARNGRVAAVYLHGNQSMRAGRYGAHVPWQTWHLDWLMGANCVLFDGLVQRAWCTEEQVQA
ncbi:hypothetical protein PoB_005297300 [Plakobranchus ocellatus]|uniref:Uncharacterized protein n=1 Tax=Plakobranchus ocellatus TaxID=259542 RepID=A0AAV4C3I5_9GAST|nr:hypothetical protein PoB_005297300 [Plakobranchus ocellatus]